MKNFPLTRHHLHWLLGSLGLVYGLHAPHLPVWVTLLFMSAVAWRYMASRQRVKLPKMRWLFPIAFASTLGIIVSYGNLFARDASVSLLATMMALKLLESHTRRDAMLLVFLAYFLGITSFMFSQSLLVGAYLLLPILALTATLISVNHPDGSLPVKFQLRLAGVMLAQSAPIMLVLFLLFPRIPGPLWGIPEDATSGTTGLSDQMSPGSISQLSRSDSVAFRAEFEGKLPDLSRLYWRGPVLWHYDGKTWTAGSMPRELPRQALENTTAEIRYSITLEPHQHRWLFMLDMPSATPPDSRLTHDYQVISRQPVSTRMRYRASSFLTYKMDAELSLPARKLALQLPPRGNPKARELGLSLASTQPTDTSIVEAALKRFREQPFRYTLNPPLLGADGVDEFLFTTRSGFCEHYSGSFVFLMRAAGVPARVVTGYQGGEFNPNGHYLLVRQADAHAWAEVWLQGRGWVRIDPTAAVAPQRIESGVASALPAGEPLPTLMRTDMYWLRQLYLRWDMINNNWNQWVLGYDQKRQIELLSRLAGSEITWQDMVLGLTGSVGFVVLAVTIAMLRRRRILDPLQSSFLHFSRKLAKAGVVIEPHEGPIDFGRRASIALPAQAANITAITTQYGALRYGTAPEKQQVEAFKEQVRKFRL